MPIMKKVTIMIPVHNEEKVLPLLVESLNRIMESGDGYMWDVLLINDGSTDGSLDILRRLHDEDVRYGYIDLSRNFGKEKAMLAGYDHAEGDCVITMDADLQDPPELVVEMLQLWEHGYDDIYAQRRSRGRESWLRKSLSLSFYRLLQSITDIDILPNVGDFRLLDRKCVDALCRMRENERYTKGLFCWIGFKKKSILFDRGDRAAGKSSWRMKTLFNLAIDGITSFTTAPLRIAAVAGAFTALVSLGLMFYYLFKTLFYGDTTTGFPTLVVLILFLGAIQLLALGIIGEYLGRIFIETKRRPPYLIREINGTIQK